ncbi:elongation factor P [uncultured Porphyromonas sp.]|uniref:elongation factor P n=1 Tax=uncultured Porphyromonas sp. TaxID=159274 RepID=UPI0025CD432E|nr:elongation factor P [uncultured Porphyromonas sp.]
MITTAEFKNGVCLELDSQLYEIVEFLHVKPGKGPAFVRTKLRNLRDGRVLDKTWSSGVKVKDVRIERRPYQYLYKDEMGLVFMHPESFEQITIPEEAIVGVQFLKEGDMVEAMINAENEEILTCELPAHVTLEVTYTEPAVKGNTATNASKSATVETGAEVMVPLFITTGERIEIDTRDGSYVGRAKE